MLNLEVIPSGFAERGRPDWSNIIENTKPNGFTSITRCLFTATPVSTETFFQQGIPRFQFVHDVVEVVCKRQEIIKSYAQDFGFFASWFYILNHDYVSFVSDLFGLSRGDS